MARCATESSFSALGRAVWDETEGMAAVTVELNSTFSALGRAVWDETLLFGVTWARATHAFSALGRAVWDETDDPIPGGIAKQHFQCSRSSRMG